MDRSIQVQVSEPERKIVGWRCSADGQHFAEFPEKRCKYCQPIYEDQK